MATVAFLPETMNLAETTRGIEVARRADGRFSPTFAGYGGPHAALVTEAGMPWTPLEPAYTPEKIDLLWRVDRMETLRRPFTDDELDRRVRSELAFYEATGAEAVVLGATPTAYVSARAAGLPLLTILPFSFTRPFLEAGHATFPDRFRVGPLRWLPERLLARVLARWLRRARVGLAPFDRLCRRYGVPRFPTLVRSFEGDHVLIADVPEITGVARLPPRWRYVGPISARLPGEMPPELDTLDHDRPWVYCAFGSSGERSVVTTVLEGLGQLDVHVIAPITELIAQGYRPPPNVRALGWVPAHLVNPRCDVAIIHGGHGTVQTALASATPFVGIGMQPEQQWNIEAIERAGAALHLPRRQVHPRTVAHAVRTLLHDDHRRRRAVELQAALATWDGPSNAADAIAELIGRR